MKTYPYSEFKNLEERDTLHQKLLMQSPDLIFHFYLDITGNMIFPFLSESAQTYFELSEHDRHQTAFKILKSRIHPEDFHAFLTSIQVSKRTLKTWQHNFRVLLPEKGLRWYQGYATVEEDEEGLVGFYGKLTDATRYHEQDTKLKLSEERFQFALQASSEGIWDLDVRSNRVFYSSQSMKMLEFDEHDRVDSIRLWDDRVHPEDKERYLNDIQAHIDNKTPYYENAQRVMTQSGEYKWILSRGKIIQRDALNNPLRIIGTHTDISFQKQKEEEMMKTMAIIEKQNSRLLNFAHIVSHNLRSHSSNIEMLLSIIDEESDQSIIQESFKHLKTSSKALTQTIAHLKELVEIQSELSHQKENLNLNDFLGKTLDVLAEEIKSNKVIIQNKLKKNETILFNPAYLESILLNFTSNAIRYAHPERIPVISYTLKSEKRKKVLEIQDNGLGINLEKHGEKLFGMYKTFHKHKDSRGIGLFITKNQIEAMGGAVQVHSVVGEGTTFKIYFNEQ